MADTLQEDRTPLLHASKEGKEAVVAALLEAKADVNSTDKVRRIAIGEHGCGCIAFNDFVNADYCWMRNIEWRKPWMHRSHGFDRLLSRQYANIFRVARTGSKA